MIVGLLGGRAAEDVVFDSVTTGASNDIEKATSLARSMVTRYGMSKRFGLMGLETVESQYLDGRTSMNCSEVTAAGVDEEVMKLLKSCYKEAKTMIKENRAILDKLAGHLIEKETITGKEFMEIYCKEKGIPVPVKEDPLQAQKAKADKASDKEDKEEKDADKAKEEKTNKTVVMDFREVLTEGEEKLKESTSSDSSTGSDKAYSGAGSAENTETDKDNPDDEENTASSGAEKQKADEEIEAASTEESEDSQNVQDPDDTNDFREV